ncbi:MAG: cold shock domain-containing protein [Campylobacteraceae bacterium]|nr:cold shock domain-containing protein [Campylobacteraceae bacterium]
MEFGCIKFADQIKKYGFIKLDSDDREIFFHKNECVTDFQLLKEGAKVTFDIADSRVKENATCAINVKKLI